MILASLILVGAILAWDYPEGEGGEPDGYIVYAGTSSGVYEQAVNVGLNQTFALEGFLIEGQLFFLTVTAYNEAGESGYGNEVTAVIASVGDETPVSAHLEIYPNPFQGSVSIMADVDGKVEIYNILGQKLQTGFFAKGKESTMDTRYLANGAYFFRFQVVGSKEWRTMRGFKN